MKAITSEFLQMIKEHKLLIAIVAVIAVPILYAGMFLWAFWDPYDHLEDVPVAIVNEDSGYDFEDERLELGDELVDKLKDEAAFNFQFVDKETGIEGLNNEDYYIMIEIPSTFSEYASTVMDDVPKQVELIYTPNESFNFLAAQIGETAMLQIEMALEEKITETYAEAIFEGVEKAADGLVDASDAAGDLEDGAEELEDGSGTLKEHLLTMAESTITFKEGVSTAADGTNTLSDGASTLADGVGELYDNSLKLKDASGDLEDGAGKLKDGATAANAGVGEINGKIPDLIQGTTEVQNGLGTFEQELPKAISDQISQEIDTGADTILGGTNELRTGIVNGMEKQLAPELSQGLTEGLSAGLAEGVVSKANGMIDEAPGALSDGLSKELTDIIRHQEEEKKQDLLQLLQETELPEDILQQVETKLDSFTPDYNAMENDIQAKLEEKLDTALQDVQLTEAQEQQLAQLIRDQIEDGINDGVDDAVNQTIDQVHSGFDQYEKAITDGLDDATNGLDAKIASALRTPMGQLQEGLGQLNNGQEQLADGLKQLEDGSTELADGTAQLVDGQQSYGSNMQAFTSSFAAADDGAITLADGAFTLSSGMLELVEGSGALHDATNELADGSGELHDGMNELFDGTIAFHEALQEGADEASDISASEDTNKMVANPVDVKNEKINEVPNYGTGFAPYFLSLGLFVGALLLSIVYPLREPAEVPTSGTNWFIGKLTVLVSIGILQAIIASVILLVGLGLEVQSVPLFILFAIITSLTFITLIQFLVTCLGDPGRFIAIIVLILQLTTSAGTFPLELVPKILQPFNFLLPMTYSVQGFKAVISSGNYQVLWQNAGILFGYTFVFMLLTLSYFIVMYKRKFGSHTEDTVTNS